MERRPNHNKERGTNLIDVTIFGTPPPQATSTIEKKPSSLGNWEIRRSMCDDKKTKRSLLNDSDVKQRSIDSSLGILDNISSCKSIVLSDSSTMEDKRSSGISSKIDAERELARQLLQRCSEPRGSSIFLDRDKENDGNLQNLTRDRTVTLDPGQRSSFDNSDTLSAGETSRASENVVFKPNEISARSSVLNTSFDKTGGTSTSMLKKGGISFDTTAAAELMAQFGDEEFQSGSRVNSRMLADEVSWNQNYSYAMPMNISSGGNGEKERLELSCFSGIIGDFDLSTESYAGRRVSVGEFFQRKCGNIGQLQENDSLPRPSFGVSINSPSKRRTPVPLIDDSTMTDVTEPIVKESINKHVESVNLTKQHSLMSLSSIAQALNDIENGSPRRLVDELIQAKRNKKPLPSQLFTNEAKNFNYPASSLTFDSSAVSINEKPERDTAAKGKTSSMLDSPRFSLDSKIVPKTPHYVAKLTRISLSAANRETSDDLGKDFYEQHADVRKKNCTIGAGRTNLNESKKSKKSSIYHSDATRNLLPSLDDSKVTNDQISKEPNAKQNTDNVIKGQNSYGYRESFKDSKVPQSSLHVSRTRNVVDYLNDIKRENETLVSSRLSPNLNKSAKETSRYAAEEAKISSAERDAELESRTSLGRLEEHNKSRSQGNIVSTRNTNELFSCIVGVSREAEIEVLNGSERWMTCTLALHQIQESKENIVLNLPDDTILVEPDKGKFVKIGVKVRQMGRPIIAVINVTVSDMVTRSSRIIKHVMCFVPEEPQIGVIIHSGQDEIDFQIVAEKCSKTFPVTLENKNNAELPVRLMIIKHPDEPQIFTIDNFPDEGSSAGETCTDMKYTLTLKPHQQFTVNIQCSGIPLAVFNVRKGLYRATGKLIVQLRTDEKESDVLLKEISLNGTIGVSKIDLVDTQLPVVIPKKESKPITLLNSGDLAVLLSASFVENDKSASSAGDFSLKPNNLFLQAGEKGVILISRKSSSNIESSDRQVFVKIAAGGNEYYYPVIGENGHVMNHLSPNNGQRCTTPQSHQASSPSSPHSSASNRSGNSGRHSPGSAASTSTISGDVIPIQSTHAALVWSSLKTGKTDIKELTILNKSENKIRLQVYIVDNNKSFKFLKERNTVGTSMLLVLQRMGSKVISVVFGPSSPGACAGKIIFTHYNNSKDQEESSQRKSILLYGYGGIGKVEISQAFKDTGGLMWLSLGHMNAGGILSAKIKLQNTGDLCSYAVVKLTPKALYPAMISSWQINPSELLLGPGEIQWVKLEFHPRREDLALLRRADVSHVGTITITHGDEPTRWRIRRLYNKLKDTGKLKGAENDTFRNIVFPLCKAFPGEALIPDLSLIKDSVQHLGDLCRGVSQHQVMLTMEVNADETLTMLNDNVDDTQMFYSVCSDSSSIFTAGCESYMPSETITDGNERGEVSESDFTVTPAMVTLAPPFRTEATVTVSSLCSVAQPFETILSHRDGLSVVPTEGMIPAGRSFPLKVQCNKQVNKTVGAVLQIFMENQKREVLITISSTN